MESLDDRDQTVKRSTVKVAYRTPKYIRVNDGPEKMEVRVGRGRGRRGRAVANAELRDEIRNLRARLEALETGRHHEHTGHK